MHPFKYTQRLSAAILALAFASSLQAESNAFVLETNQLKSAIQPTMYGLFFEDINFAADGGLYAELIKNRSFEFPQNLMGWNVFGKVEVRNDGPFDQNPHYVRLGFTGHNDKRTGLENEGFFGIGVKQNEPYRFSVWARIPQGSKAASLRIELVDPTTYEENHPFAQAVIQVESSTWKQYTVTLQPRKTVAKARLRVFNTTTGTVDLEHVSLFPVNTWKNRENGLRKDLAQALYDLKPGVFRFPGGCIVEGTDLNTRYNWKNSIGAVENRPLNENRWHYTFANRLYPDYYQTYGLGFFEFFQLCEDLGAEALPVLSCGLACQFQNNNMQAHVPVAELQPYIQDALDLIEFANGDAKSTWGKIRAEMGHPAPFNLKLIAIGNEQWGPEYIERLEPFVQAIRKKYPEIKIVGGSGPNSEGDQFKYLWPEMTRLKADLVDEHFYRNENWFLNQGTRYDNYDRKGPKVFAGEYACHGNGKKFNHFNASLMEAAFMTGLERNADIVHMATYAPLFAHYEGWQWRPDLIWYDNLQTVRSSSYYVQKLYATYKGSHVLSLTMDQKPIAGKEGQHGLFASSAWEQKDNQIIVKVINTSSAPQDIDVLFKGLKKNEQIQGSQMITFNSAVPDAENTLANPNLIAPNTSNLDFSGQQFKTTIPAKTFAIYIFNKK